MIQDVSLSLVRAENELRALKTAHELAYSTTMYPENNPQRSWTGYVDFALQRTDGLKCQLRVRFTRTDNITDVPMVDFAWNYATNPTYQDYLRHFFQSGRTTSGKASYSCRQPPSRMNNTQQEDPRRGL